MSPALSFAARYLLTPIAIFLVGYVLFRWFGKKAVAEMSTFDLLITMLVATTIVGPLVSSHLGVALYYAAIVGAVYMAFSYLTLNNRAKKVLVSNPTVLIRQGDIVEEGLHRSRMTVGQLMGELRSKGFTQTADVELAVLEEVGKISVIAKADARPVQPRDLQLGVQPTALPIPLVMDGEVLEPNLRYIEKDRTWLRTQMQAQGIDESRIGELSLATWSADGSVRFDMPSQSGKVPDRRN